VGQQSWKPWQRLEQGFLLGILLMYAKFCSLEDAREVFDRMPQRDDHGPL
jgi:pentatricopeptide repeat protein